MPPSKLLLTYDDAAEMLSTTHRQVAALVAAKKLRPTYALGRQSPRFEPSELERFIDAARVVIPAERETDADVLDARGWLLRRERTSAPRRASGRGR